MTRAGSEAEPDRDFEGFYLAGFQVVVRACMGFTSSPDDAFDVTQEAFLRTFQNWEKAQRSPDPLFYTLRVARNLSARQRWRTKFYQALVPKLAVSGQPAPVEGGAGEHDVLAAIRSLPRRQREAIVLCGVLEFDSSEAARILGVSSSTLRVHLARARARLKSELASTEGRTPDE